MTSPTEERLGDLLHDLVQDQPFTPDVAAIERAARQARRRARRTQSGIGVGAVVVVAAVAVGATNLAKPNPVGTAGGLATTAPTASIAANGPLVSLAADIAEQPAPTVGDATLVDRAEANNASYGGWDLYTDDGHYYYARNRAGLPKQVRDHDDQGGGFARELAAARYAVDGDLTTARQRMAQAPMTPGTAVVPSSGGTFDNRVWDFGMDALLAGSSNPQVRAGVLRLYSTLPEVTVTRGTVEGQPALTLTASAPALPDGYAETLNISADTGVPLTFQGGPPAKPDVFVTYTTTRVTVAEVAAGKF